MPTAISPETKKTAEQQLEEMKKRVAELERNAPVEDTVGGQIRIGKRWSVEAKGYVNAKYAELIIYRLSPSGTPIATGATWKDKSGNEHPRYQIERVLRLPESVALKVFAGEAKAGTLWYSLRRRN